MSPIGLPNQIILKGKQDPKALENAFNSAWVCLLETCRFWIQENVDDKNGDPWKYSWKRAWTSWANYSWEFFCVQGQPGDSISQVRTQLDQSKHARNWTGINWTGESSTLSGTDAIAWPGLGRKNDPRDRRNRKGDDQQIQDFYAQLSQTLGRCFIEDTLKPRGWSEDKTAAKSREYGESFITPLEQLSVPELVKRLLTHGTIAKAFSDNLKTKLGQDLEGTEAEVQLDQLIEQIQTDLSPETFREINRLKRKNAVKAGEKPPVEHWTGWFQGDGDRASGYLRVLSNSDSQTEAEQTHQFSREMRTWGQQFQAKSKTQSQTASESQQYPLCGDASRVIYAGGDDFMGVLFDRNQQLSPQDCLTFFSRFKSEQWNHPAPKKITASVGFVWAGPKLPQREVLQQCRAAEQDAKAGGRDRIAFRILFNNGNFIQWICPWWILEEHTYDGKQGLFNQYADRNQDLRKQNPWVSVFQDVAVLEARHAFGTDEPNWEVTQALFQAYFGEENDLLDPKNWWNQPQPPPKEGWPPPNLSGILGDPKRFDPDFDGTPEVIARLNQSPKVISALNDWVIQLAKVGFYLHKNWEGHDD